MKSSIKRRLITAVVAFGLLLAGCQTPFLLFPGRALEGETAQTSSFAFAADHGHLVLEVNPASPYSVILRTTVIDGHLYIDAANRRKWGEMMKEDPRVRIAIDGKIYNAVATPVTDSNITEKFRRDRTVYRIDPAVAAMP